MNNLLNFEYVIPAPALTKVGGRESTRQRRWIPAFAGMTTFGFNKIPLPKGQKLSNRGSTGFAVTCFKITQGGKGAMLSDKEPSFYWEKRQPSCETTHQF